MASVTGRDRVTVQGRVVDSRARTASMTLLGIANGRVMATRGAPAGPMLDVAVADDTGTITLVFYGRSRIRGLRAGVMIRAAGRVVDPRRRPEMVNPRYELVPEAAH